MTNIYFRMIMLIKLAVKSDIPLGSAITVQGPNGNEIALFNLDGKIFALNAECPHMGGPLGEGEIEEREVTCPWHGRRFDISNGECLTGGEDATCYPVTLKSEDIYVDISN